MLSHFVTKIRFIQTITSFDPKIFLDMAQQLTQMMASLETTDDGNEDNRQQTYAKDSMDRFGDDMYGLILSYLSLEDRFRNECVSKQFQRTVFESVVDITIDDKLMRKVTTQTLATIATKCPNIETIDCRGIKEYKEHIPEVLHTLRDNCRHLQHIYCGLWPNIEQTLATLGPLVTRITPIGSNNLRKALTQCDQLSHLAVTKIEDVFDIDVYEVSPDILLAKHLHSFELSYLSDYIDNYKQHWSAFVTANQSLQSLAVKYCWFRHTESLTEMCGQLSRLTQLRRLTFGFTLSVGQSSVLADSLRTIGVNCKQLKRLSLQLSADSASTTPKISLHSLVYYRRLKRLNLMVMFTIDDLLLDQLRHCKRLTHLELILFKMTANVLKNLHINCPRIQYLSIRANDITPECLSHISRLPALQTLVIRRNDSITSDLISYDYSHLLSTNPKLKGIEIRADKYAKSYCRQN